MRITLGTFARSGIETHCGPDIPAAVEAALAHYTRGIESGRTPVGLPPFCREQGERQDVAVAVDFTVDRNSQDLLEREARRQGATVSQLAVHSVLSYLAELDFIETVRPAPGGSAGSA